MDPQIAQIVVLGVTALGVVVWAVSLLKAMRLLRRAAEDPRRADETVLIDGEPEEVAKKIAKAVTTTPPMGMFPLRVGKVDAGGVTFRSPESGSLMWLMSGLEGRFEIRRAEAGKVRVGLRTNHGPLRKGAKVALAIIFALGLPLLVGIPWLLLSLVVDNANPAARAQAIQVIHVGHALWPPFLFMWLAGRTDGHVQASLGQVLDRVRFGG